MSKIINFVDRESRGTFSQIQLDDGKRILVSLSQTEIVIFKLALGGMIPTKRLFEHSISEFIDFFCVRVGQIGINGSVLKGVVDHIMPCKSTDEVVKKLSEVVEGYDDPVISRENQKKLKEQVANIFMK